MKLKKNANLNFKKINKNLKGVVIFLWYALYCVKDNTVDYNNIFIIVFFKNF